MWLIKVNKNLIDRNELLLAEMLVEKIEEHERNNKKRRVRWWKLKK